MHEGDVCGHIRAGCGHIKRWCGHRVCAYKGFCLITLPWSLVTMPDCGSDGQKLSCDGSTMFHLKIDIC